MQGRKQEHHCVDALHIRAGSILEGEYSDAYFTMNHWFLYLCTIYLGDWYQINNIFCRPSPWTIAKRVTLSFDKRIKELEYEMKGKCAFVVGRSFISKTRPVIEM